MTIQDEQSQALYDFFVYTQIFDVERDKQAAETGKRGAASTMPLTRATMPLKSFETPCGYSSTPER